MVDDSRQRFRAYLALAYLGVPVFMREEAVDAVIEMDGFEAREPYHAVKLREHAVEIAYDIVAAVIDMAGIEANAELIAQIEGGIKRETSVGCSVAQSICSICGAEIGTCSHEKGKVYGGERCCAVLTGAVDAYEWSFVAVPAQRSAGVIKSFIESEAGRGYAAEFAALEKSAQLGRKYLDSLRAEVLRLCLVCDEKMHPALEKSVQLMEEPELIKLKDAFEEASAKLYPPVTQLPGRGEVTTFSGEEYII